MAPEFWSVAKFAEFQHYSQRNPPWIKLHTRLLDDARFITLPDGQKIVLIGLFLQAARSDNKILNDPRWLQSKLGLKTRPDFALLQAQGWIEPYREANDPVLASRKQNASNPLAQDADQPPPGKRLPQSESESETYKNPPDMPPLMGEFANVKISDAELEKLVQKFGEAETKDRINRLSAYMASKGKAYKSHYATILTWARKDEEAASAPSGGGKSGQTAMQKALEAARFDMAKRVQGDENL